MAINPGVDSPSQYEIEGENMTPPTDHQIVERLAKLAGYEPSDYLWWTNCDYIVSCDGVTPIFNPLNNLDDARQCENKLWEMGRGEEYADFLYLGICAQPDGKNIHTRLIYATARQRCEAMYRVLERDTKQQQS